MFQQVAAGRRSVEGHDEPHRGRQFCGIDLHPALVAACCKASLGVGLISPSADGSAGLQPANSDISMLKRSIQDWLRAMLPGDGMNNGICLRHPGRAISDSPVEARH